MVLTPPVKTPLAILLALVKLDLMVMGFLVKVHTTYVTTYVFKIEWVKPLIVYIGVLSLYVFYRY